MNAIRKFIELERRTQKSLAIVGDSMIDEYYFVDSNRLSPEFPIPIFLSQKVEPDIIKPGGAANVWSQLRDFNAVATLYSYATAPLSKLAHDIPPQWQLKARLESAMHVPIKKRLYYGDFPLCRWDIESDYVPCEFFQDRLHNYLVTDLPDVIILSDYNKGFFRGDISRWLNCGRPTIIDPKKGPASKWRGCTIFKPNIKEARELTGTDNIRDQLKILWEQTEARFVIITDGGNGVWGLGPQGEFSHVPRKTVKANSVIGAGDCFVAMLTLAYAHGMSIQECVEVAFEAGAVYVQKKHNEPITPYELLSHDDHISAKFVHPEFLANRKFSLCFTNGCFDILHEAHIDLLRYAKTTADKLVVALNTDESVRRLKGENRPVNNLESRKYMLSMFEFVDFIVSFDQDTPLEILETIKPDVLCKGGDYSVADIVGHDLVKTVKIFPYIEGKSTSNLIEKMRVT